MSEPWWTGWSFIWGRNIYHLKEERKSPGIKVFNQFGSSLINLLICAWNVKAMLIIYVFICIYLFYDCSFVISVLPKNVDWVCCTDITESSISSSYCLQGPVGKTRSIKETSSRFRKQMHKNCNISIMSHKSELGFPKYCKTQEYEQVLF